MSGDARQADAPFRPFDPNAAPPDGNVAKAIFPSTRGVAGAVALNANHYLDLMRDAMGDLAKALTAPPQSFAYSRISYMPDTANYGLLQWPGLSPQQLRKLATENVAPRMVIQQRRADILHYSGLATHPWKPGWRIVMRDARETVTRAAERDMRDAERFIRNCNMEEDDPRRRDAKLLTSWQEFLMKQTEDIEVYDSLGIWTDMELSGKVKAFAPMPAGQIRVANPTRGYRGDTRKFAALLDETETPVTAFTRDELIWRTLTPRNDPAAYGYGFPVLEQALLVVQAFQGAIELNRDTFVRNGIPNGMILLKGDFWTQDQVDLLMREYQNMKKGISKAWGVPVLGVPVDGEVEIIKLNDIKGEEIRYRDHMNLMAGLYCILSQFPARRLGLFASGHPRDNMPLPQQNVETGGIDDPGLPARLLFLEETINPYILWTRWPHLSLEFTNKDPKSDAREYEFRKNSSTWGESRALSDMPRLTDLAPTDMKPVAEIMELCPEDPVKAGVFQTVAVAMLKAKLGEGTGKDDAAPGARMQSKQDPAKSEAHGHTSGVRRNSAAEAEQRSVKEPRSEKGAQHERLH